MTTVQSIAKNSLFLLSGQIINLVLGLFYFAYMAGYLGAKNLGILNTALSLTLLIGLLGDLGLSSLMIREVSRNQSLAPKYAGNILLIKILLSIITIGITAIVVNILGYPEQTIKVIYIITLYTIATNFTQVFTSIFQAFERFEFQSLGVILNSVLMTVGVVFSIHQKLGLIYFAFVYFIVNVIVFLYSFGICLRKLTSLDLKIDWIFLKQTISESIPFWLNSVFVMIYFKIDMVMLSIMSGNSAVGWYSASYKLIDTLSIIPVVLMSTMYPVFSKFYISSRESLEFAFKKSFKILAIIAIPIGIGTTILAERIILLLYGKQYLPSAAALQILIWASVLSFINYPPSTYLTSTNRQKTLMAFTFIGAMLNIILNFILIPRYSYHGAAVATVSTELVVGLLMMYSIHKMQNLSTLLSEVILKSLIAGTCMAVFLQIFHNFVLLLLILFAAIIYFIALYLLKGFEKEDIDLFNQVLGR